MPGPRVAVIVRGENLPTQGKRWEAYKTAAHELGLDRSKSDRAKDRLALKEGKTLNIKGFLITKA